MTDDELIAEMRKERDREARTGIRADTGWLLDRAADRITQLTGTSNKDADAKADVALSAFERLMNDLECQTVTVAHDTKRDIQLVRSFISGRRVGLVGTGRKK